MEQKHEPEHPESVDDWQTAAQKVRGLTPEERANTARLETRTIRNQPKPPITSSPLLEKAYRKQLRPPASSIVRGVFYGSLSCLGCYAISNVFDATGKLADYGFGFFIVIPIIMGFAGTIGIGYKRLPNFGQLCLLAAAIYITVMIGLLVVGFDGAVCLFMAAPLMFALILLGAGLGFTITCWLNDRLGFYTNYVLVPLLPLALVMSTFQDNPFSNHMETTTVVIDAPPEKVWPMLFKLPKIEGPLWWMFAIGVAHPEATRSTGEFVGARRECVLSTGKMEEAITAVEPNRLLRFDVLGTPPSMKELNPFHEIHPKHLSGYCEAKRGELKLIPLPNGKTELVGTTWYSLRFYPDFYWSLWSDTVVEQVHRRVMDEIKRRAELPNR